MLVKPHYTLLSQGRNEKYVNDIQEYLSLGEDTGEATLHITEAGKEIGVC